MTFHWTHQSQGQYALWSLKTVEDGKTEWSGFLGRLNGEFDEYGFRGYSGALETSEGRKSVLVHNQSLDGAKRVMEEAAIRECENV